MPTRSLGTAGEEVFVGVAPRMRATGAVRQWQARAGSGSTSTVPIASACCGVFSPTSVSPGDRLGRVRRCPRLLEAHRAATCSMGRTGRRRERADRTGAPADHPCAWCRRGGRPDVADPRCAERSRVMRLAGTVNHKSGPGPGSWRPTSRSPPTGSTSSSATSPTAPGVVPRRPAHRGGSSDPYKRIPPPEYFKRLAGINVPRGGLVSCPVPHHRDRHPSCKVGTHAEQGWCCHSASCGARGAIYDLASVLIGGPWGPQLRGAAFARARAPVVRAFGPTP